LLVKALVLMHERSSAHKATGTSCEICEIGQQLEAMTADQARADDLSDAEAQKMGELMEIELLFALQHAVVIIESRMMLAPTEDGVRLYQLPSCNVPEDVAAAIRYALHRKVAVAFSDGSNTLVRLL
ncbi:MAG TPA: hypothetical protein VF433_03010, partial [Cellvibrio sp.]